MNAQTVISLLGALGLGSLLTTFITVLSKKGQKKNDNKLELKESRYKAIILLNISLVNFEAEFIKLKLYRPNIKNKSDLEYELKDEWINMLLYASDDVIRKMKIFLEMPNYEKLIRVSLSMREDLYGIKTSLKNEDFILQK